MKITSAQNQLIKKVVSLKSSKGRKQYGEYILEGVKPVKEALGLGLCLEIFAVENKSFPISELCSFAKLYHLSEVLFKKISTLEAPEGILAVMPMKINDYQKLKNDNILLLEGVQDPGNVGTLLRSAESFGFKNICLLDNCADVFSPKVVRSSMGSILRLNIFKESSENWFNNAKIKSEYHWVGLDINGSESMSICVKEQTHKIGVIIGSESHGISEFVKGNANELYRIKMSPHVDSLNAGIAGSIMMHLIFTQKE